ncbi:MAG: helix-turn-helix domain-containing protein [Candidatus Bathyarchaeia archaeon]
MSHIEKNVNTLIDFGLTSTQAKIYLGLLWTGPASIKEIARASKVARPDTYRAISELREAGIVEKIVAAPNKFKPLGIMDAVGVLMLRRTKESADLNKRANELIESSRENTGKISLSTDSKFVLVPGDAVELELQKLLKDSKASIRIMVSKERTLAWIANNYVEVRKALKRGVKIRVLTQELPESSISEELRVLTKLPNFGVRYIIGPPTVWLRIFDDKEIILSTSTMLGQIKHDAVFSNNHCLVELAQSYFNAAWFQRSKLKTEHLNGKGARAYLRRK